MFFHLILRSDLPSNQKTTKLFPTALWWDDYKTEANLFKALLGCGLKQTPPTYIYSPGQKKKIKQAIIRPERMKVLSHLYVLFDNSCASLLYCSTFNISTLFLSSWPEDEKTKKSVSVYVCSMLHCHYSYENKYREPKQ